MSYAEGNSIYRDTEYTTIHTKTFTKICYQMACIRKYNL